MTCGPVALSRFPVGSSAEQDGRVVRQRAGNRHALLFAARELRRIVMHAIAQPDFAHERIRASSRVLHTGNLHRHEHVLERGERRQQVEELEDDPDLLAAEPGERLLAERRDVDPVEPDVARGGRVQAGDEPEQRGFAAPRRASDGDRAATGDLERCRVQNGQWTGAAWDGARNPDELDHEECRAVSSASFSGLLAGRIGQPIDDITQLRVQKFGDDAGSLLVGMDAVRLVERGNAADALEQKRHVLDSCAGTGATPG